MVRTNGDKLFEPLLCKERGTACGGEIVHVALLNNNLSYFDNCNFIYDILYCGDRKCFDIIYLNQPFPENSTNSVQY